MQVSLITCTSNSEKTIEKCCRSVHSQTYNNIEHIIVDKEPPRQNDFNCETI